MKWKIASLALSIAAVAMGTLYLRERSGHPSARIEPWTPRYAPDRAWGAPIVKPGDPQPPVLLLKRVQGLKLNEAALEDVLKALAEKTKTNIVGDWNILRGAAVWKESQVTLDLTDVTLGDALNEIGAALNTRREGVIGPVVEHGIVRFTFQANPTTIRVYDIRELLRDAVELRTAIHSIGERGGVVRTQRTAPRRTRQMQMEPATQPASGLYIPSPYTDVSFEEVLAFTLQSLIEAEIDPESWISKGGRIGQNRYWAGRLIITQTEENHRKIEELLYALRPGPATKPGDGR